jgi:CHASE2 domain-containing sensor protein
VPYRSRIEQAPQLGRALRTDIVILACAVSAGIHAALTPDHFAEGTGAGVGFVAATVLLLLAAVIVTRSPSQLAFVSTIAVFAGLIGSYALVLTTGVPVLHPGIEAADGLAVATKAVEAVGLVTAASLVRRPYLFIRVQPKGTLT